MCLSYLEQQVPLRKAEKDELFIAGLERKLNLDLVMNAEEFCSSIFEVYPQLKKGMDINF